MKVICCYICQFWFRDFKWNYGGAFENARQACIKCALKDIRHFGIFFFTFILYIYILLIFTYL